MSHPGDSSTPGTRRPIRWWIAVVILVLGSAAVGVAGMDPARSHQQRNLTLLAAIITTAPLLLAWWGLLSNAPRRWRATGVLSVLSAVVLAAASFRITGVSGDLLPIFEFRWKSVAAVPSAPTADVGSSTKAAAQNSDFPQFLGPNRDGTLRNLALAADWSTNGPVELWRHPVGPAWSGFVVVDGIAYTQEQHDLEEWITAYELNTGKPLWHHASTGRYATTIAGEGPRATPTLHGDRLYAMGATGNLTCVDRRTGKPLWSHSLTQLANCGIPEWGFTSSPLVSDDLVIVQAGGKSSVWAFHTSDGRVVWSGGEHGASYGSPALLQIGSSQQLVVFGSRTVLALDPKNGRELWKHPFGTGMPLVANPLVIGTNRLLVSAGYNVGATALEIQPNPSVTQLWSTRKLKAKFSNPALLGDMIFGLDDGILAGIELADGEGLWKEGRYGHGQGLLVGNLYVLMAESGEICLLQPTRTGPGELARRRIFDAKTWNPIALAGNLLVVRNDREAACLRLPLAHPTP